LDYKPAERSKYIEAFFSNIDWNVVGGRIQEPAAARRAGAG
jgi:superoxide dismutase